MINEKDIQDYKEMKLKQPKSGGMKFDQAKPPMALLDPAFLEGVASVLAFGANKYAANNWRNGIEYTRLISALYRHLGAINGGEDIDPESGLSHAYHLGCCVMFLSSMMNTRKDLDDRWKPPVAEADPSANKPVDAADYKPKRFYTLATDLAR